jgi:uncharacterized membrane protein YkvI
MQDAATFFAVTAQIIPLLMVTLALELQQHRRGDPFFCSTASTEASSGFNGHRIVTGIGGIAEINALAVLGGISQDDEGTRRMLLIGVASLSFLVFILPVVASSLAQAEKRRAGPKLSE